MRRGTVAVVLALVPVLFVVPLANADPTASDETWYLDAMKVPEAQELSMGEGVVVGVIDTGVDPWHVDLEGRVLEGATVTEAGVELGGSGDPDGHGTAMAGLIAGSNEDDDSLVGVAPKAQILPVRIERGPDGTLDQELVYEGVRWAIEQGATVINLSLAGKPTQDDGWKRDLISYAIDHNAVIIAAVGNRTVSESRVGEPASIPGVVAVSGMGKDGEVWSGSVTGAAVVLCAPAEDLPHIKPGGGSAVASGTSAATALVSGTAALIRSKFPRATAADVISRLIATASDVGGDGRDPEYGYGTVDAYSALTASVAPSEHYPLDLPDDVNEKASVSASITDIGGWWLAVPALLAVSAGLAAFFWLMRRSRGRQLAGAETD